MGNPSIRGHQGTFKVFKDGVPAGIVNVTNVSTSLDSSMSRSFYVGNAVPEGDQTIEGWSGSFETEVKDAVLEDFFDALIEDNLNGIGISDYSFSTTEFYGDGTSKTHLYLDCQFKYSRSAAGLNEKITKSVEFQAARRVAI